MEVIPGDIYDFPKYYDLVFGSDWQAEFKFLTACFAHYCPDPPQRLFEPACGTGRLMYRFANAGFQVQGIDLNVKAIEFCNRRLEKIGKPPSGFVADMAEFVLEPPCDVAFNTVNSFRHLTTESQAHQHLTCISQSLKQDGIYVLGIHLYPDGGPLEEDESWTAQRGALQVRSHMSLQARDLEQRHECYNVAYDVTTPAREFRIQGQFNFRTYTAAQLAELVETNGHFEIEETFDFGYDFDRPIEIGPETEDVIYILRKKSGSDSQ